MIIEITKPEVESMIAQRLQSGAFRDAEEVILDALRSSGPRRLTGADLVSAIQKPPFREIEIEPSRERSPVRDVVL